MYINGELQDVKIVCINLSDRKDKRRYMEKQCKRRNIPINFYTAKRHNKPSRGCLESHLSIIRQTINDKTCKYLMILEDDCQFKKTFDNFPLPPPDWDMIFLGGTVKSVYDRPNEHPDWVKMCCWTTHAYIINMTNKKLLEELLKMEFFPGEIDTYYINYIQNTFNVYMINPMMAIQKEGYSDIECQNVNYDFMEATLQGLKKPQHTILDGNYVLKLPYLSNEELPTVSVVTPTYNRRNMFSLCLYCFMNLDYPREKMEWVILDDTPINGETRLIKDMIPQNNKRIKYINVYDETNKSLLDSVKEDMEMNDGRIPIGKKRNMCVELATNNVIIHMDDDDYYPPESILARVKTLMAYKNEGIECVGSSKIGVYDIINDASTIATDGDLSIAEATMAYTRHFWELQKFNDLDKKAEYRNFIANRFNNIMDIPYSFVIIAISHYNNYTDKTRRVEETKLVESTVTGEVKKTNYYDTWNEETKVFMDDLRQYLKQKHKYKMIYNNI